MIQNRANTVVVIVVIVVDIAGRANNGLCIRYPVIIISFYLCFSDFVSFVQTIGYFYIVK